MVKQINVGIIGTGWCGGIRAEASARHPLVNEIHIAETRPERLAEVAKACHVKSATTDWQEMIKNDAIDAFMISATPEHLHYPMAKDCLARGKHVFLEKPIAIELHEADDLIRIAKKNGVKFTIGYSQRFNPKYVYVHKCATDGTLGRPVSALVSRHIGRSLGKKITGRSKLSPAAMEATHDLDFLLWCLLPAKPIRVYSQNNYGAMRDASGADVPDTQYIMVTMDNGVSIMVGAGWSLPPAYPNFASTWIEFIGTEGALIIDDTHRDTMLSTVKNGIVHPMSTMPGEYVEHTYAGPMGPETDHFIEAAACDRPVLVTPEQARAVMEVYFAADISAERHEPVNLPLPESR
ncbi:MAG: Gfo/Idh/MocA family oxidoreductase [Proteobacteria bacterium]|nr:Gfo/Idh/MocA family oxidoreductase [Burkholderiales bacterium]